MTLSRLIQRLKACDAPAEPRRDPVSLATAAILLEAAHADGVFTAEEGGDVAAFLSKNFSLDEEETKDLLRAADELRRGTIDHWALTSYVRTHAPLEQRIGIVRAMWRIVYSDRKLTDYENYIVRKLADLLGLEHHVMISAKVEVLRELGLAVE